MTSCINKATGSSLPVSSGTHDASDVQNGSEDHVHPMHVITDEVQSVAADDAKENKNQTDYLNEGVH